MAAKKDPQTSLFDRTIESAEIEEAIGVILSFKDDPEIKRLTEARKTVPRRVDRYF